MKETKMIKYANVLDMIAKVVDIIFRCSAVFLFIITCVFLFGFDKIRGQIENTVELGPLKIFLSDSAGADGGLMKSHYILMLVTGIVLCVTVSVCIRFIRQVLSPMKEGRPFTPESVSSLKKTAWTVLIGGGISQVMNFIMVAILRASYPFDKILSGQGIDSYQLSYHLDIGFILLFFIILSLSYIFAYGQQLQQESDETL